jgi:L-fucose mutarotase
MLKGIDPVVSAELLHVLMLMGHGDDLLVCDVNHPAATIAKATTYGRLVDLSGCGIPRALEGILKLLPLDTFVDAPVTRMLVVDDPERRYPIFDAVQAVCDAAEGRSVGMQALERFAFYEAGRRAFAVVRTADPGPYGCFLLKKGVV